MNYRCYAVGQVIPEFKRNRDSVLLSIDNSGIIKLITLCVDPSPDEIANAQKGDPQLGIYYENEILFVLSNFGDMAWSDAPYHASIDYGIDLEEPGEGGYLLATMLADSSTGEIKAFKAISLPLGFSEAVHVVFHYQKVRPISILEYNRRIDAIYARMSVMDMVWEWQRMAG